MSKCNTKKDYYLKPISVLVQESADMRLFFGIIVGLMIMSIVEIDMDIEQKYCNLSNQEVKFQTPCELLLWNFKLRINVIGLHRWK